MSDAEKENPSTPFREVPRDGAPAPWVAQGYDHLLLPLGRFTKQGTWQVRRKACPPSTPFREVQAIRVAVRDLIQRENPSTPFREVR